MFSYKSRYVVQALLFKSHLPKRFFIRSLSTGHPIALDNELTTEVKKAIEEKWGNKVYGLTTPENSPKNGKLKYVLSMFPYPSGHLHLGHVRVYTLSDVLARFNRLRGYEVVHPIGWDAFGLPAENAARDRGIDPAQWTKDNIATMKDQIVKMGCCFDWDRELSTCDPRYYQWTQWIFLKLWQEGLLYKKRSYVFWDPVDQTVLAEEQVDEEGHSWRSGAKVERKLLKQWFVRTAVYAKKLSAGLDSNLLREGWRSVADIQKGWIGPIQGFFSDCHVLSENSSLDETLRIWFSSPEPLRHAQFVIISPSHYLVENEENVAHTFSNGLKQMNFMVLNPATGINLPVFTGPDSMELPIIPQSADCRIDEVLNPDTFPTIAQNDSFMTEIRNACDNRKLIGTFKKDHAHPFVIHPASLKLHDWLVSRQRKWGTPIPAVECADCGMSSVVDQSYLPFNESTDISSVKCHNCGSSNLTRDTDTLDTFFDSSWYYFRYLDVNNSTSIFDPEKVKPHLPVDIYIGGLEHAHLHLYYTRFMSYFLEKLGLIHVHEPFHYFIPIGVVMAESYRVQRTGKYITQSQVESKDKRLVDKESGLFVAKKWEKMSKSKNNGVNPEQVIGEYGIDTTRLLTLAAVAPASPRKWEPSQFSAYLKFQRKMWVCLNNFCDAKEKDLLEIIDDDEWTKTEEYLFDRRNYFLRDIIRNYGKTHQISVVVTRLQEMFNNLLKVSKNQMKGSVQFERMVGLGIICSYPVMPAFSAQLWESFRDVANLAENEFSLDKNVWEQRIPTIDPNYNLELICEVSGVEVCTINVPRAILDNLELNIALDMALEHPKIEKRVPRETCSVLSYTVEPNFKAWLNIINTDEEERKRQYMLAKQGNVVSDGK